MVLKLTQPRNPKAQECLKNIPKILYQAPLYGIDLSRNNSLRVPLSEEDTDRVKRAYLHHLIKTLRPKIKAGEEISGAEFERHLAIVADEIGFEYSLTDKDDWGLDTEEYKSKSERILIKILFQYTLLSVPFYILSSLTAGYFNPSSGTIFSPSKKSILLPLQDSRREG